MREGRGQLHYSGLCIWQSRRRWAKGLFGSWAACWHAFCKLPCPGCLHACLPPRRCKRFYQPSALQKLDEAMAAVGSDEVHLQQQFQPAEASGVTGRLGAC